MQNSNIEALVSGLIQKARTAQQVIEGYNQNQVDALVRAVAKVVFDNAESLAKDAVEETRMGRYEDKVKKNKGKARVIWNDLKGKKSVGIIRELPEEGLIEVAKPMGVVGAVTPTTNPIVTPMCNAMFALKGRNAILISPHPRSKKCSARTVMLMREAIAALGAPEDLIQVIEEPSVEASALVMKSCDVCISTGGMGMVRAAYSSGKPAFGVGAGNVQCILGKDADIDKVVPMIIEGRAFDNGIICSAEQTAIVPEKDVQRVIDAFVREGAYYISSKEEVDSIRKTLFPDGVMNKVCVGQSAAFVAEKAGIQVPENTKVLLVRTENYGEKDSLSSEKMAPVITLYTYKTWEEAVDIAQANLNVAGLGHSVCIHSHDKDEIEYAALKLPVSRILLNQVCATSNGGSFFNGLSATTTLGCGSWGNNSISENLSWKHLLNISRVADVKPGSFVPDDEQIWGKA
ncbi:MAG: aldehyde dehydrogenase family protein [Christensenellales bacterium]|jgi:succinate-semialdehyde dehydrogenase